MTGGDRQSQVFLNDLGIVCAAGRGKAEVRRSVLGDSPSGITTSDAFADRTLSVGQVRSELSDVGVLPPWLRSRNNALLLTALAELGPVLDAAIARWGRDRVGVVLGTSTSGIGESERAMAAYLATGELPPEFHLGQQELGSPARAVTGLLGLAGPASVISTACSSSARALASAARLLRLGVCDAVLAGGADSLCRFTIAGFRALDAVSESRCNPMSVHRCGINIGEGAAVFLVTREPGGVRLAGWGESSDAHHVSAPQPDGLGAIAAMRGALQRAGIGPEQVDYVNLHGTATVQNDAVESRAVHDVLGADVPASSTKPLTGHTLGAAGAVEAGLCWLTLRGNDEGHLPPHWWDGSPDPALAPLDLVAPGRVLGRPVRHALSNSFAFGGSNAALVLSQVG